MHPTMPFQEIDTQLFQKVQVVDKNPVFRELVAIPAVEVDDAHVGMLVARR